MKTICLDPVTSALLTTRRPCDCAPGVKWEPHTPDHGPFLSFATVDRPPPRARCDCHDYYRDLPHKVGCASFGPSPWIDQQVAIYADKRTPAWLEAIWPPNLPADASKALQPYGERVVMDAIVGSGTLAEALPIVDDRDDLLAVPHIRVVAAVRTLLYVSRPLPGGGYETTDISDQLPLQDWSPGRWALRFTDVAPIVPRWKRDRTGTKRRVWLDVECPVVAPVLSGDDPTYKEWRP